MAKVKFVPDTILLQSTSSGLYPQSPNYTSHKKHSFKNFVGIVPNRIFTRFHIKNFDTNQCTLIVYLPELGVTTVAYNYRGLLYNSQSNKGVYTGEFTLVQDGSYIYLISIHDTRFNEFIHIDHTNYNVGDQVVLTSGRKCIYLGTVYRMIVNLRQGKIAKSASKIHIYKSENTFIEITTKEKCKQLVEENVLTEEECQYEIDDRIAGTEHKDVGVVISKTKFTRDMLRFTFAAIPNMFFECGFLSNDALYFKAGQCLRKYNIVNHYDGGAVKLDLETPTECKYSQGSMLGGKVTSSYYYDNKLVATRDTYVSSLIKVEVVRDEQC